MPDITFAALGVPEPLVRVLAADGKLTAFPIQADTLADTLAGRDVLGRGKTGSGKTLAFCLPLATRLGAGAAGKRRPGRPRGLILAPTRELAAQIEDNLRPLAAVYGLVTTTIFGGVKQGRQVEALKRGVDIVVACPGRLDDLMNQGYVTLDGVEITVLDEADHMADLGFLPVVTKLMAKTPARGQRMLFSATLDHGVDKIVRRFLSDPVLHSVDSENSPVAAMTHHVFEVATAEAKEALVTALASGTSRRILFTRTKHHAKKLAKRLTAAGIPAFDLQGNLSQSARVRHLAAFGDGSVKVLVATDVAARGVHIDDVELVVHVDPPIEHKAYLHRSGRTARAGSAGDVVTVCLPAERGDLAAVLRKAKIAVTPLRVTADSAAVTGLVGEVAAYVAPEPVAVAAVRGGSSRGDSNGRGSGGRGSSARGSSGQGSRGRGSGGRGSSGRGESARRSESGGRDGSGSANGRRRAAGTRSGRTAGAPTGRATAPTGRGSGAPAGTSAGRAPDAARVRGRGSNRGRVERAGSGVRGAAR
jgi:superfamily II DNA/RNA helicase